MYIVSQAARTPRQRGSGRSQGRRDMQDKIELLNKAKDMAAVEVRRRGLRGMRAEVTETALVDLYFKRLVAGGES